ncbi:hypothetical protein Anapl_03585 [Anas platyrhynchos]|uniref:Uncharacterized protein n=1 Tax=Anas platyrhynchos TaxID=8839 RepID=R0KC19_ANAPL|nr:hypothetical protein Anapl_03585 [Anas platyrhynchos]
MAEQWPSVAADTLQKHRLHPDAELCARGNRQLEPKPKGQTHPEPHHDLGDKGQMLKEAEDGKGMAALYEKSISFVTHSQGTQPGHAAPRTALLAYLRLDGIQALVQRALTFYSLSLQALATEIYYDVKRSLNLFMHNVTLTFDTSCTLQNWTTSQQGDAGACGMAKGRRHRPEAAGPDTERMRSIIPDQLKDFQEFTEDLPKRTGYIINNNNFFSLHPRINYRDPSEEPASSSTILAPFTPKHQVADGGKPFLSTGSSVTNSFDFTTQRTTPESRQLSSAARELKSSQRTGHNCGLYPNLREVALSLLNWKLAKPGKLLGEASFVMLCFPKTCDVLAVFIQMPQLSGSRLLPTSLQPPAKQATGFTGAAERPYTEHLVMNERIAH